MSPTTRQPSVPRPGRFFCYMLGQSWAIENDASSAFTYNGYTVNLKRRLRQHNGEIKGGAFATKSKRPLEFISVMTCDTWTNVRAMQVEWLSRYPTRKKPRPKQYGSPKGRLASLKEIISRMLPDEQIRLYIHPRFFRFAQHTLRLGADPRVTLVASLDELTAMVDDEEDEDDDDTDTNTDTNTDADNENASIATNTTTIHETGISPGTETEKEIDGDAALDEDNHVFISMVSAMVENNRLI